MNGLFPEDPDERKTYPVFTGFVQYFPSAMAAIAHHSYLGNEKHNKGQPLHWDRRKSGDEADAQLRHLMEGDYVGMGWRAMALLQKHLEAQGAPIAPAARNVAPPATNVAKPATPEFAEIESTDGRRYRTVDGETWEPVEVSPEEVLNFDKPEPPL